MTTPSELPTTVFEPARLARLSRGLLTTLRSLSANRGSDEWTGVSVNKKLAIQRFYKDFEAWIRERIVHDKPEHHPIAISDMIRANTVFSQVGG